MFTSGSRPNSSTKPSNTTTILSGVWKLLKSRNISDTAANIILRSWRNRTKKQYTTYLRQWEKYCSEQNIDSFSATVISSFGCCVIFSGFWKFSFKIWMPFFYCEDFFIGNGFLLSLFEGVAVKSHEMTSKLFEIGMQ